MTQAYEAYTLADPSFYDAMHSEQTAGASFSAAARPLPEGWQIKDQDDWLVVDPGTSERLPAQGWKIHASATLGNAERVVGAVWDYCVPRGIQFKFLRSVSALNARVSKYAPRGYSGKLVAIYPSDDTQCETILRELGQILDGEPNPYILTDLRWGNGPLFVRYGAFAMRYMVNDGGELVPAITNPEGELVPDSRNPVFTVPPWVTLPAFLEPHLAARNATTVADLPYKIEKVLHFSNGGGIYAGTDTRTGEAVVLKEARPHSGLDAWGEDAVCRLQREHDILTRLAGIPGIPKVYDLFTLGEHRFLVMEQVDGEVLSKAIVLRFPLTDPTAGPEDYAEYADWAVNVHAQVERTLTEVHERGVIYGDLHLFNVIVRPDGSATLLDFEVAGPVENAVRPGLAQQGFAAPRSVTGVDVDKYALACLRLALFLPMTNLVWLHRPKATQFVEIIKEHFPVPPGFLERAIEVIVPAEFRSVPSPGIEPEQVHWPEQRDAMVRAILASATPDRDDRLFPGDIQQFATGGLGLAYGAAGVLYAISAAGGGRHPQHEEWLLRRATNPASGTRPGLFDGLHGVAFALDHLGYRQQALDVLDICLRENWESLGSHLSGGLAGIGLNLLHFADKTGEPVLRLAAHRAAELVCDRLREPDPDAHRTDPLISGGSGPSAGLMQGKAGQALLLMRIYDETGDDAFLDAAAEALRRDLRRCVVRSSGTLEVNEGWRTMPYLAAGSVGIGLALDEYLMRRPDEQFAEAVSRIELTCQLPMYILPGMFTGRAGILQYLAGRSAAPATDPLVTVQLRNLGWHALPYADGIAFPGTGLLRLSMDLATGTAGVLLAIAAALHDQPIHLPLLAPTRSRAAAEVQAPAPTGAGL
ncbi:MAG TPA: class III lanthionine synthetase LanKC [Actinophytocola sp.]|uniref:class III lanthionine synthetase LanKC n=1 Tax=Actinophytocola sp. TaxID=1872138 RepID=UPI002DBCA6DD|nr:class III lanthionine synthetase LanKC [Actinophytocola sp.]HEU5475962.1 class III lanthionine synthetase LanKC [Actinophytocola sp.]